jgi:hypothetical protein
VIIFSTPCAFFPSKSKRSMNQHFARDAFWDCHADPYTVKWMDYACAHLSSRSVFFFDSTFLKQFKVKPPMFNGRDIFACDLNDTIRFDISTKGPSSENSVTISVKPNHQTMMRVDES